MALNSATTFVIFTVCCVLVQRTHGDCDEKFKKFPGHTACLDTSNNATPDPPSEQEKTTIVNKHNTFRSGVSPTAINMMKLSWDDEIAMIAQKWANTCPLSGRALQHDKNQQRFVPGRFSVGQNMAWNTGFEQSIQNWYDEVSDYTYGTDYNDIIGAGTMVGHYTQMVWAESVKIGCGRTTCDGSPIVVCNYAPAGNVGNFDAPYERGTKGSDCKDNDNGLCDCGGVVCRNGVHVDTETCTCDCGDGHKGSECSLNCELDDPNYCGIGSYTKDKCTSSLAASVSSVCPTMCNICPYAEAGYVDPNAADNEGDGNEGDGNEGDGNEGDGNEGDGNEGDGNEGDGNEGDGNEGDGDDEDEGGAATVQVCLSLLLVTLLTACSKML